MTTTTAATAATQPEALRLADEAAKLAPILASIVEGGATDGETDIYADDYCPPDGDVYVYRAGDLLAEMAAELRPLHALALELADQLSGAKNRIAALSAPAAQEAEPTCSPDEYRNNTLEGVALWLHGRSKTVWAEEFGHAGLMQAWARDLQKIASDLRTAPQAPAAATESVLIDGVAYSVPAAVAGELLRLHMEAIAAPAAAVAPAVASTHEAQNKDIVAWRYNRVGSELNPQFIEAGQVADDLRVGRTDPTFGQMMKPSKDYTDWLALVPAAPTQEAEDAARQEGGSHG